MKTSTSALSFIFACLISFTAMSINPGGYTGNPVFKMPDGIQLDDYKANSVVIKFKENYRQLCTEEGAFIPVLTNYLNTIGAGAPVKVFAGKQKPFKERNPQGIRYSDLSLIYEVNYTANVALEEVINRIYYLGLVQYAEPWYIPKPLFTPNDPNYGQQGFLSVIRAPQAWDIEQGDPNVVIGICDTGIQLNHSDLDGAISYNTNDPINGNDDDNDGYIDNYQGWDVGMNDNDPTWQGSSHGVHVSGCASPETNNSIGVAGSGFDTKILPVKIANQSGQLIAGYTGIVYAADHDCDIINCSWGGPFGGSLGQDVIDYATINKDVLVVAGCGNGATEEDFFPASFKWVLSIAATQNNDMKAGFSSYSTDVDVCAPGVNILATVSGGGYGYNSGTSMASPIAAGAAAIVKSQNPSWTAIQVGEQLKATADDIYFGSNTSYLGKLGTGRINMELSLGGMTSPSVMLTDQLITDNNDNTFVIGDTLRITDDFTNYLANTNSCNVTLTSNSTWVTIQDGFTVVGTINTLQTVDHNADPFQVKINTGTPLNTVVPFTITLTDGNYTAVYTFDVTVNVDYINIPINEVASTMTSKNGIGYNADGQVEGLGFEFPLGTSLMYDASLMMGVSGKVSDHARDPIGGTNDDFVSVMNVKKMPNTFSEFDVMGMFNDDGAGGNKLDVGVTQRAFAWTLTGHTRYIIFEYTITNNSSSSLSGFYAGIFVDWDVMDYTVNRCDEDVSRKMGYTWSTESGGLYAGTRVLSNQSWVHYGMDNDGSNGSIDVYTEYSTSDKFTSMSTSRPTAGQGDVSDVNSAGPLTINAGDSVTIAFALVAGDDLADLEVNSDSAYVMYNGVGSSVQPYSASDVKLNNYPNPATQISTVEFSLPMQQDVNLAIYDMLGHKVRNVVSRTFAAGKHTQQVDVGNMESGVYFYELSIGNMVITQKMTVTK